MEQPESNNSNNSNYGQAREDWDLETLKESEYKPSGQRYFAWNLVRLMLIVAIVAAIAYYLGL